MIDGIKTLLFGGGGKSDSDFGRLAELREAVAALLVEAACLDGHFSQDEREAIERLLTDYFGLSGKEALDLVGSAQEAVSKSSELYGFARIVKDRFEHKSRIRMIEMLWEVAYADGRLHDYEANLVRRVAGLIHVPDRESGAARKRVLEQVGI